MIIRNFFPLGVYATLCPCSACFYFDLSHFSLQLGIYSLNIYLFILILRIVRNSRCPYIVVVAGVCVYWRFLPIRELMLFVVLFHNLLVGPFMLTNRRFLHWSSYVSLLLSRSAFCMYSTYPYPTFLWVDLLFLISYDSIYSIEFSSSHISTYLYSVIYLHYVILLNWYASSHLCLNEKLALLM